MVGKSMPRSNALLLVLGGVLAATAVATALLLARRSSSSLKSTASSGAPTSSSGPAPSVSSSSSSSSGGGGGVVSSLRPEHTPNTAPPSNPVSASYRVRDAQRVTIAYATTTGTCKRLAESLASRCTASLKSFPKDVSVPFKSELVRVVAAQQLDWWDQLLNGGDEEPLSKYDTPLLILIIPTWTGGTACETGVALLSGISDITQDWRVDPNHLKHKLRFAVYGVGSSAYDNDTFCKPARTLDRALRKLGATPVSSVGTGDVEAGDIDADFEKWGDRLVDKVATIVNRRVANIAKNKGGTASGAAKNATATTTTTAAAEKNDSGTGCCKDSEGASSGSSSCACKAEAADSADASSSSACCSSKASSSSNKTAAADEEEEDGGCCGTNEDDEEAVAGGYGSAPSSDDESDGESAEESGAESDDVVDVEDMGPTMKQQSDENKNPNQEPKEMVTPKQAKSLKKEGYKLIGTHSAVKMCRWTKHQLRGRGGCYKHTFYGITSYQCMEATPSLACANKCVFCWRHHKNPVGRTWRWKTDEPDFIVAEAVKLHIGMIKEAKGIPGVLPDRWKEAHTIRHCALSLVGEPIMYPQINQLLQELHKRKISTFLVTNAQHPDAIETLVPVTQLYVSVDAPTPASLDAIDRPLFKDAWQRLRRSLTLLRDRDQRTVARLTLVKGWNSDEIEGYAELMALGRVSFIEVKGVTFCGTSDASTLNMSNSPWHHEVKAFTEKLRKRLEFLTNRGGPDAPPLYGMACEHKHSCSVLLARCDQFLHVDPETGKQTWRTWMDYDRFQELAQKNKENGEFKFGVMDYLADTPAWAMSGAAEEGFDPTDLRFRKKGHVPLYTKFDDAGVPTHDSQGAPLEPEVAAKLQKEMDDAVKKFKEDFGEAGEIGGITKEVKKGGERVHVDPKLMFRGLCLEETN